MEYTLEEKYELIKKELLNIKSNNPIKIIEELMNKAYINMHGPEHHFLDGAALLTACKNAGADFNLITALDELSNRSIKMPGAMCGYWGVCGSSTSIGAALSIIHQTTPISSNSFYKDNMEFTSKVIGKQSVIGGPRCCKRNAFISLSTATTFIKEKYNIDLEESTVICNYSNKNKQCIGINCPFF